ncbi:MAG: hypothetical protein ACOCYE_13870, partial [Pseudomonadota bacterium]
ALAVALLWLATPAAAFPEGSFAAPERDARVLVERTDDGGLRVELEAPDFGAPLRADLVPRADGTIFEEPLAPRGFLDRLVSRRAERLPFEGRRLVWAARMEESLVVTTFEVDHGGHPDLRRAELSITEADELRLALWRYAGMTAAPGPRLVLQRVER